MTEKYLKSLIDKLNKNRNDGLIQLRPLTVTVDFAKVWTEAPKPTDDVSYTNPYKFYFIKNSEGIYVAAVLDMTQDLHWFVSAKHRRQGHLTKALKETILPHLFQENERETQRITINADQIGEKNSKASQKVAFFLGFVKTDNNDYILENSKYQTEDYISGQNTPITKERLDELKKQMSYLGAKLSLIQSEVEMKLGDGIYAEELNELVDEIRRHIYKLEDAWYDSQTETA